MKKNGCLHIIANTLHVAGPGEPTFEIHDHLRHVKVISTLNPNTDGMSVVHSNKKPTGQDHTLWYDHEVSSKSSTTTNLTQYLY